MISDDHNPVNVEHDYSGASEHTITITGDSVTSLNCQGNQLTALDVSNNTALRIFYCGSNQLTTLDVSSNTALKELYCNNYQLTASTLTDLFKALPTVEYIVVWDNPGKNDCDYFIAQEKRRAIPILILWPA